MKTTIKTLSYFIALLVLFIWTGCGEKDCSKCTNASKTEKTTTNDSIIYNETTDKYEGVAVSTVPAFNLATHIIDIEALKVTDSIRIRNASSPHNIIYKVKVPSNTFVYLTVKTFISGSDTLKQAEFYQNIWCTSACGTKGYDFTQQQGITQVMRLVNNKYPSESKPTCKIIGSEDFRNGVAVSFVYEAEGRYIGFKKSGSTVTLKYLNSKYDEDEVNSTNCSKIIENYPAGNGSLGNPCTF